jgi:hypothetical protein
VRPTTGAQLGSPGVAAQSTFAYTKEANENSNIAKSMNRDEDLVIAEPPTYKRGLSLGSQTPKS